jgi:trimethylamine---corrinoid protein Co-methyltransferase
MDERDLEQINHASLHILETIGVRLEHDEVLQRILAAGAKPGSDPYVVRLPRPLIEEALAQAPPNVILTSTEGKQTRLNCTSDPVYWTCPVLHVWTGESRREVTSTDLAAIGRIASELEHVQGVMGVAMADVLPQHRDFVGVRILAENTSRHIRALCFSGPGMQALISMKSLLPGNWFSLGFTAHGPLRWTHLALDIFLASAGHGIPVTINGEPMAGVTGPVTLAGTVAVGNAEILAGIVVNQVLEPGRPVIYNFGLAHVFDMKHATAVTGGPENALLAEASAALGRFYGLPSSSWVSTEALYEDEQAALEKMFGFQTHSTAGVSLIWGMGQLESEMTLSLAQLIIDDEMISFINRHRRGFTVNAEALAIDTIRDIGIGGSFLGSDHTLEHFRQELFHPRILNRAARGDWSRPVADAARERAARLLHAAPETRLPEETVREFHLIEKHFRSGS